MLLGVFIALFDDKDVIPVLVSSLDIDDTVDVVSIGIDDSDEV